jgi:hypothetical protein
MAPIARRLRVLRCLGADGAPLARVAWGGAKAV